MKINKFIMCYSKVEKRLTLFCGLFFLIFLLFGILVCYPINILACFICCGFSLFILMAILATFKSCFEVEGNLIKYNLGIINKTHQFYCNQIEYIDCLPYNGFRHGKRFKITIVYTTSRDEKHFTVSSKMDGFSLFAEYLLDKLENDEIKASAISNSGKKILMNYKKGIFDYNFIISYLR